MQPPRTPKFCFNNQVPSTTDLERSWKISKAKLSRKRTSKTTRSESSTLTTQNFSKAPVSMKENTKAKTRPTVQACSSQPSRIGKKFAKKRASSMAFKGTDFGFWAVKKILLLAEARSNMFMKNV